MRISSTGTVFFHTTLFDEREPAGWHAVPTQQLSLVHARPTSAYAHAHSSSGGGALHPTHRLDANRPVVRRQQYVRVVFVQALQGLHFLHSQNILHQSLGANSVLVSSTSEQDVATLSVRLQVVPRARLTCTPGFVWG